MVLLRFYMRRLIELRMKVRFGWTGLACPFAAMRVGLKHSAALGKVLAGCLNPEASVPGVSSGMLRPSLRLFGLPTKRGGKPLDPAGLSLTAGWGSTQSAGGGTIVMPGRGLTQTREYTPTERFALDAEAQSLGMTLDELLKLVGIRTLDIHLNADVFWSNVPEKVWDVFARRLSGH